MGGGSGRQKSTAVTTAWVFHFILLWFIRRTTLHLLTHCYWKSSFLKLGHRDPWRGRRDFHGALSNTFNYSLSRTMPSPAGAAALQTNDWQKFLRWFLVMWKCFISPLVLDRSRMVPLSELSSAFGIGNSCLMPLGMRWTVRMNLDRKR